MRDWLEIDELEKGPVISGSEIWSPLHAVTLPRALQERPARLKSHRNRDTYKIENILVLFLGLSQIFSWGLFPDGLRPRTFLQKH